MWFITTANICSSLTLSIAERCSFDTLSWVWMFWVKEYRYFAPLSICKENRSIVNVAFFSIFMLQSELYDFFLFQCSPKRLVAFLSLINSIENCDFLSYSVLPNADSSLILSITERWSLQFDTLSWVWMFDWYRYYAPLSICEENRSIVNVAFFSLFMLQSELYDFFLF
jgi:hypothetical protein